MGRMSIFSGAARPAQTERREPVLASSGNPENPSTNWEVIEEWMGSHRPGSDWMPHVSEATAMACSAVYRCVALQSGFAAGLPLKIYKRTVDGGREEAPNHRLAPLFKIAPFPGRAMTAFAWRELWSVNMLLWGNSYSVIRYDNAARVIGFEMFPPWRVTVLRDKARPGVNVYRCLREDDRVEYVEQEDMIHLPGLNFDGIRGLSRIQSFARGSVGLATSLEERTGRVHQNAAMPSGVLNVKSKVSKEGFQRLRAEFNRAHSGVHNWGGTIVADEGSVYTPFQLSPEDLQTIESRRYQVADISRFFGTPLHMLNETDKSTSWGTGLTENRLAYQIYTIDPDLNRIEAELNYKLFAGTPFYIEFDRDAVMSMDPEKQATVAATEIASGVLLINEARRKKNRPPVEGGDAPLINSTNVPLATQAQKQPDPPAGKLPPPEE